MSVKIISAVFEHYPEGGGEMLLALALADHAHDDGTSITASVDHYADKTRQSTRTIQYQLGKMQRVNWLLKVSSGRGGRPRSDGFTRSQTSHYRINPRWLKAAALASDRVRVTFDVCDESGFEKWVQNLHPFVDTTSAMGASHGRNGCNPEQDSVQQLLHPNRQDNRQDNPPCDGIIFPVEKTNSNPSRCREFFQELKSAYPKPDPCDEAWPVFLKLDPDAEMMGWMLRAIKHQAVELRWERDDGRWIPKLVNWLRGARWKMSPGARGPQASSVPISDGQWPPPEMPRSGSSRSSEYLQEIKRIVRGE